MPKLYIGAPIYQDVSSLQFGDELLREGLDRSLGDIRRFCALQRGGGIQRDVRDRAAAKITRDDPQARVPGPQP
jgi:hypothetical protein